MADPRINDPTGNSNIPYQHRTEGNSSAEEGGRTWTGAQKGDKTSKGNKTLNIAKEAMGQNDITIGQNKRFPGKTEETTIKKEVIPVKKEEIKNDEPKFSKSAWLKEKVSKIWKKTDVEEKALAVIPPNPQIASLCKDFKANFNPKTDNSTFLESISAKLYNLMGGKGKINISQLNMVDLITLKGILKTTQKFGDKAAAASALNHINKTMLESKDQVNKRVVTEMICSIRDKSVTTFSAIEAFTELQRTHGDIINSDPTLKALSNNLQTAISKLVSSDTLNVLSSHTSIRETCLKNSGEETLQGFCNVVADYLVFANSNDPTDQFAASLTHILNNKNGDAHKKFVEEGDKEAVAKVSALKIDENALEGFDPT